MQRGMPMTSNTKAPIRLTLIGAQVSAGGRDVY